MPADHFIQYLMSGLTQGSVYALVGLGFAIIFTVTGIINFAQGEFVMLGGVFSYILFSSLGLPLIPSAVLAVVAATAIGCIMYLLGIRPARKASTISLIIITIGAAIFIRGVVGEFWGREFVRPPHFTGNDPISLMGASIDPQRLWIIGTALAVTIVLHIFLSYTMVGKALRACSVNRLGATLVGIDFKAMALIAFALAAAIGAVAGIVVSPLTTVWVNSGIMLGLKGFVAAAIGVVGVEKIVEAPEYFMHRGGPAGLIPFQKQRRGEPVGIAPGGPVVHPPIRLEAHPPEIAPFQENVQHPPLGLDPDSLAYEGGDSVELLAQQVIGPGQ